MQNKICESLCKSTKPKRGPPPLGRHPQIEKDFQGHGDGIGAHKNRQCHILPKMTFRGLKLMAFMHNPFVQNQVANVSLKVITKSYQTGV